MEKDSLAKSSDTSIDKEGFISQSLSITVSTISNVKEDMMRDQAKILLVSTIL